ncbi:MAG: DNA polymerase III subunit delta [Bacteroidales bacterium]|nr:DNA polymerase III subunit delta [Bacteroidales bacterium]
MFFKDITGHNRIKENLLNTIKQKRMSHAWLFAGAEGNGKLAMAIAYAQYLSCLNKGENDSCGKCSSCKKYEKLVHPDLHFVFPVVRTKKFTKPVSDDYISVWRNFILESPYHGFEKWLQKLETENQQAGIFAQESGKIIKKLSFKPYESEYKTMIIWLPEKMNVTASNKLLKMIEEPPPKTLFILVAEDVENIIKTILSRVQLIKIPKISRESMFESIKNKYEFNDDKVHEIVRISDGNFLKANELTSNSDNNIDTDNFIWFSELMRLSYGVKINELINWSDQMSKAGREVQKRFLEYTLQIFRENFILNINPENQNKIVFLTDKEKKFSVKFYKFIHKDNILKITNEFTQAYNHIERNGYGKLIFLDLALKTARLLKIKPQ